ncbi:hypothetical protein QYM36_001176, partial [Artemia franciscana]
KLYNVELGTPIRKEILKAIKLLKKYEVPGQDGLSPELHKQCPEISVEQLNDPEKAHTMPDDLVTWADHTGWKVNTTEDPIYGSKPY